MQVAACLCCLHSFCCWQLLLLPVVVVVVDILDSWAIKLLRFFLSVSLILDPFVKIRVYDGGERKYKKKTAVKHKTTSPKYEESFDFIVTGKRMPQTSVILHLYHHGQRFLNNDALIGAVFLGYQFELDPGHPFKLDYGAKHWASIIEKPHLPIEEWHPIQALTKKGIYRHSIT